MYAAVFLHKVVSFDVTSVRAQINAIDGLVSRLISTMEEASKTGTHVCHIYGEMLGRLWRCRNPMQESSRGFFTDTELDPDCILRRPSVHKSSPTLPLSESAFEDQMAGGALPDVRTGPSNVLSSTVQNPWITCDGSTLPSWEDLTIDHFWPGITEFSQLLDSSISA